MRTIGCNTGRGGMGGEGREGEVTWRKARNSSTSASVLSPALAEALPETAWPGRLSENQEVREEGAREMEGSMLNEADGSPQPVLKDGETSRLFDAPWAKLGGGTGADSESAVLCSSAAAGAALSSPPSPSPPLLCAPPPPPNSPCPSPTELSSPLTCPCRLFSP